MKIQDRSLIGTAASGAAEAQRLEREGSATGSTARAGSEDRVTVSGLAGRISRSLESSAAARQERVTAMAQQYAAGNLKFDSAAVGRAVIDDALSAHAA